jgi:hypothetical protein
MAEVVIIDQRDGTVDAAVTGTGGDPWDLYAAQWSGPTGLTNGWGLAASGTGDGTTTGITPPNGTGPNFWSLVIAGQYTAPLYAPVRAVGECPWMRTVSAVKTAIIALNLPGIGSTGVKLRQLPRRLDGDPLPLVIVSPWPAETVQGKLNARDDIGYPATVVFFDGANGLLDKNIGQWLDWRHQIAALLRESRIETGQTGVYRVQWRPDIPASVAGLQQDYLIGAMLFEGISREPRGPR